MLPSYLEVNAFVTTFQLEIKVCKVNEIFVLNPSPGEAEEGQPSIHIVSPGLKKMLSEKV